MSLVLSILIVLFVVALFLAAFVLLRTLTFARPYAAVEPVELPEVDPEVIAGHLAEALRCQTVMSENGTPLDPRAFKELHKTLEKTYPRLHASLRRHTIGGYSLVYTWVGKDPQLAPVLFMAHLDVVPADPASLQEWEHQPFSGDVADGYVWGRGALDLKNQVIAIMEATEALLRQGFQPERTIFLAFGQDEEVSGLQGAKKIASALEEKGVHLEAVLDEGGFVMEDSLPGVTQPVALIGTAEKGYLTLELSVEGAGGHSSTPPESSSIGILARALTRLERASMPVRLDFVRNMFREIGPANSFSLQMALANTWLLGGLVRRRLLAQPQTAASVQTTKAVTMIQGGIKDNVLPRKTRARVNYRLLPGDSIASVCETTRKTLKDPRVKLEALDFSATEASPVSPSDTGVYRELVRTIRELFGNIPVSPYLVIGQTDARYYASICEHVYRFSPVMAQPEDLSRIHGVNERISVAALATMVQFYMRLMNNWAGADESEIEQ